MQAAAFQIRSKGVGNTGTKAGLTDLGGARSMIDYSWQYIDITIFCTIFRSLMRKKLRRPQQRMWWHLMPAVESCGITLQHITRRESRSERYQVIWGWYTTQSWLILATGGCCIRCRLSASSALQRLSTSWPWQWQERGSIVLAKAVAAVAR